MNEPGADAGIRDATTLFDLPRKTQANNTRDNCNRGESIAAGECGDEPMNDSTRLSYTRHTHTHTHTRMRDAADRARPIHPLPYIRMRVLAVCLHIDLSQTRVGGSARSNRAITMNRPAGSRQEKNSS